MKYVFVGDVITGAGIYQLFTPIGETRINLHSIRGLTPYLKGVKNALVTDGKGRIYHRIYREFVVVDRTVKKVGTLEEFLSLFETKEVGSLCELIKAIKLPEIAVVEPIKILPIIVVGSNGWENISTVPVKRVKSKARYYVVEGSLGVVQLDDKLDTVRPQMPEIIKNPTSFILARECGVDLVERKEERGEARSPKRKLAPF
jgi:hypothetical protein